MHPLLSGLACVLAFFTVAPAAASTVPTPSIYDEANVPVRNVAIVVGAAATPLEVTAANELQGYLRRMYPGTTSTVVTELPKDGAAILVGTHKSLPALESFVQAQDVAQPEMFRIRSVPIPGNPRLVIAGADGRGVLQGAYKFLESLGCGFYLSGETVPQKDQLTISAMDWTDRPVVPHRFVFNWHNFLSGCSAWDFPQWREWIEQSQKMGFNGIMVHAYGNNPMIGYEIHDLARPVGYITSTQIGRDWGTNHVNDVRRMQGGDVFSAPVFGSAASVEGSARERTQAAQALMQQVFAHAAARAMDIYFALDIDTESANPQEFITRLPVSARIPVNKAWIVRPDTPEGYAYYRTELAALLKTYPQITTLALWCRPGLRNGSWSRLTLETLPKDWRAAYERSVAQRPDLAAQPWSPILFSLAKVVSAYQRALVDLGRTDIKLAFGTWERRRVPPRSPGHIITTPVIDAFLPPGVAFMPLDWDVIRGDSFFEMADKKAELAAMAKGGRTILPVAWAHHDDGQYFGPPYQPIEKLADRLQEIGASSGVGVIHWMTKPLDLYFKSTIDQVWQRSVNVSLDETLQRAARDWVGAAAPAFTDYLRDWMQTMPRVSRETSSRFMHTAREDESLVSSETLEAGYQRRMALLRRIDVNSLDDAGRARHAYFVGLEEFMKDLHTCEHAFRQAVELRKAGDLAGARALMGSDHIDPARVVRQFAAFSQHGGMTHGEKGLLVSLNTRWLTHYEMLRQMLGLAAVRINFGPTNHEPLAQNVGLYTFHFDGQKTLWEVRGKAETKHDTYVDHAAPAASPESEIVRTGLVSTKPLSLTISPIMEQEDYAGKRTLPAGRYRLTVYAPAGTSANLEFKITTGKNQPAVRASVSAVNQPGYCQFDHEVVLAEPGVIRLEISHKSAEPLRIGGIVLTPLALQ
jgi:hypothetical protein